MAAVPFATRFRLAAGQVTSHHRIPVIPRRSPGSG